MGRLWHMIRHGGIAVLASIINLILRLIRIKLLATYLGPVGLGQIGLITNFIEMIGNLVSTGFTGTLNRELARQKDGTTANALIVAAILLFAASAALVIIPAVIIFYILSPNMDLGWSGFALLVLAVFFAAVARFFYGFYFGFQLSGRMLIVSSGSALLNLLFVFWLVFAGYQTPLIYSVATPIFLFLVSAAIIIPYLRKNFRWQKPEGSVHYRTILRMAGPIVFTSMLAPATLFYVRSFTEISLGPVALGMIQPGLQLVALIALLFSSFAAMTIVRWDQSGEAAFSRRQLALLAAALLISAIGIPLLFATSALQYWLIYFLFSEEFLPALATLPWFLSGEALRISGILLNQTFISKGFNWYTLPPKIFFTLTVILCLHSGYGGTITDIAKAFFWGNAVFLALSITLFVRVQYKNRDQKETLKDTMLEV
jgi:PST family polysaccharide transporter